MIPGRPTLSHMRVGKFLASRVPPDFGVGPARLDAPIEAAHSPFDREDAPIPRRWGGQRYESQKSARRKAPMPVPLGDANRLRRALRIIAFGTLAVLSQAPDG